jgi:cobalt/nickel transport system permease protein
MLWRAAAVLPFALCFAVATVLAGDSARAAGLVIRAYLSALAALLLIATAPMPDLIAGLEWLRVPRFLLQVMQFLYRYLIVLVEEATAMRQAGSARGGATGMQSLGKLGFRQAAAAAGVLFARSYARAEAIHRAMLSRGFEGRLPARLRIK